MSLSVLAKDGDSGNSGSGSDNSGSGNSDSGNDDSDDDSDDRDDDDSDDDDDDDSSGSGSSKNKDQDKARDAVKSGKAANLAELMAYLRKHHPGRVLKVDLQRRKVTYVYRVKLLTKSGRIQTLRLNAKTLRLTWF